jgi:hypothetical protein
LIPHNQNSPIFSKLVFSSSTTFIVIGWTSHMMLLKIKNFDPIAQKWVEDY